MENIYSFQIDRINKLHEWINYVDVNVVVVFFCIQGITLFSIDLQITYTRTNSGSSNKKYKK